MATVTFTLDEATFMKACHALWAYRAVGRAGNWATASFLLICATILLVFGVPGPLSAILIGGGTLLVGFDLIRQYLWRRYFRRSAKYVAPITATLSKTGVTVEAGGETHLTPWRAFQSFARTEDFLFLLVSQRVFSVIPLAAFPDAAQAAAFEDFVGRHLRRLPRRFL